MNEISYRNIFRILRDKGVSVEDIAKTYRVKPAQVEEVLAGDTPSSQATVQTKGEDAPLLVQSEVPAPPAPGSGAGGTVLDRAGLAQKIDEATRQIVGSVDSLTGTVDEVMGRIGHGIRASNDAVVQELRRITEDLRNERNRSIETQEEKENQAEAAPEPKDGDTGNGAASGIADRIKSMAGHALGAGVVGAAAIGASTMTDGAVLPPPLPKPGDAFRDFVRDLPSAPVHGAPDRSPGERSPSVPPGPVTHAERPETRPVPATPLAIPERAPVPLPISFPHEIRAEDGPDWSTGWTEEPSLVAEPAGLTAAPGPINRAAPRPLSQAAEDGEKVIEAFEITFEADKIVFKKTGSTETVRPTAIALDASGPSSTGWIDEGPAPGPGGRGGGADDGGPGSRGGGGGNDPSDDGGGGADQSGPDDGRSPGPTGEVAGDGVRERTMNALMKEGLSQKEAAAYMGNFEVESDHFSADVIDGRRGGDKGTARGMMQWRFERLENLKKFSKERGLDPWTIEAQAAFAVEEGREGSKYADAGHVRARKFMKKNPGASVEEMTSKLMWDGERPSNEAGNASIGQRQRAGVKWANKELVEGKVEIPEEKPEEAPKEKATDAEPAGKPEKEEDKPKPGPVEAASAAGHPRITEGRKLLDQLRKGGGVDRKRPWDKESTKSWFLEKDDEAKLNPTELAEYFDYVREYRKDPGRFKPRATSDAVPALPDQVPVPPQVERTNELASRSVEREAADRPSPTPRAPPEDSAAAPPGRPSEDEEAAKKPIRSTRMESDPFTRLPGIGDSPESGINTA